MKGPKIKEVQHAAPEYQFPFPADTGQLTSILFFPKGFICRPPKRKATDRRDALLAGTATTSRLAGRPRGWLVTAVTKTR